MVIQCQDQKAGLNFNCVIFKMQLIFDIDVFLSMFNIHYRALCEFYYEGTIKKL